MTMFPIKNMKTGEIEKKEPTVGSWYCGFDKDHFGPGQDRDGLICQYIGDGQFTDDEGRAEDEDTAIQCLMSSYDYLIEQVGSSAVALDRIKAFQTSVSTSPINLPERLTEGHPHDLACGASAKVLVLVKGFAEPSIGRYLHELEEWQVNGWTGAPDVVEWWSLPERGTGAPTR